MSSSDLIRGTMQRVVHVHVGVGSVECEGYGILLSASGETVFFVDSALQDTYLGDLRVGQTVFYAPELGPFARAAEVWTKSVRRNPDTTPGIIEG